MRGTPEPMEFAVMLVVKTRDQRLTEDKLATIGESAANAAAVRHAVLQHLPKDVQRVVAVFPVEHAKLLMMLHEAAGDDIAQMLGQPSLTVQPPPGYVPPTQE